MGDTTGSRNGRDRRLLRFLALMNRILLFFALLFPRLRPRGGTIAFLNGRIVTVDAKFSIAEAMLIDGERIVKVGTNAAIEEGLPADATRYDLKGAMVLPGLIDSHVHSTARRPTNSTMSFRRWRRSRTCSPISATGPRRCPRNLDRALPGLHHPAARAAFPDPRRTRRGRPEASRDLPHRTRRRDQFARDGALGHHSRHTRARGRKRAHRKDPATGEPTASSAFGDGSDQTGRHRHQRPGSGAAGRGPRRTPRRLQPGRHHRDFRPKRGRRGIELYSKLREAGRLTCRVYLYYGVGASSPIEQIKETLDKAAAHPLHAYNNQLWLRASRSSSTEACSRAVLT